MHVLSARVLLQPFDFAASLSFYEHALGLVRSREFGAPGHRGVVFFLGGAELEITETPAGADSGPRPAGVRLWLRVADARAAQQEAAAGGATVLDPVAQRPWGLHEGSIADPDGLELVLVEVPADHPLRRDPRT